MSTQRSHANWWDQTRAESHIGSALIFLDREDPPQSLTLLAQLKPNTPNVGVESDHCPSEQRQRITAQEVGQEYAECFYGAARQVIAIALSTRFITGTVEIKKVKNACYKYIGTTLTFVTEKWALDKVFDCCVEPRTLSTLVMGASVRRALNMSHFTQPVANLVTSHMRNTAQ